MYNNNQLPSSVRPIDNTIPTLEKKARTLQLRVNELERTIKDKEEKAVSVESLL